MEVKYNPQNGDTKLCFKPHEVNFMAFLMEQVWEDRAAHGKAVPEVSEKFFKNFSQKQDDFFYVVGSKHLDFAVSFLDEVVSADEWELSEFELFNIHTFLQVVGRWCHDGLTLH